MAANESADALEIVRGVARLQGALVRVWIAAFNAAADYISFRTTPRRGTIELGDETWTFVRHGAGVRFESTEGVVIEAHVGMFEAPLGVDAWRVHLHCESRGLSELTFTGQRFDASDHRRVDELLRQMEAAGLLDRPPVAPGLYVPTTP